MGPAMRLGEENLRDALMTTCAAPPVLTGGKTLLRDRTVRLRRTDPPPDKFFP